MSELREKLRKLCEAQLEDYDRDAALDRWDDLIEEGEDEEEVFDTIVGEFDLEVEEE